MRISEVSQLEPLVTSMTTPLVAKSHGSWTERLNLIIPKDYMIWQFPFRNDIHGEKTIKDYFAILHDKSSSNHDRAAARMRRRALISWPAIMFLCLCLSLFCLLSLSLSSSDQDEKESSDILSDHYQIFPARLKILVNWRRIIEQRPRICKTATSSLYTFMFFFKLCLCFIK